VSAKIKRKLRVRYVADTAKNCLECGRRFFPQRTISGHTTEQHCGDVECTSRIVHRLLMNL